MDLINRQALKQTLGINADDCDNCAWGYHGRCKRGSDFEDACCAIDDAPSAEPEIIRCRDCKWYDTTEEMTYGYCDAIRHSYYSRTWEIDIRRTYPPDFFCADAEARNEEQEDE